METLTIGPSETRKLYEALIKMDYFRDLGAADLAFVLNHVSLHEFRARKTLIRQGAAPTGIYIVFEGKVAVRSKKWFLGFSKEIKTLGPGDFFGEIALLKSTPRTASVRTKTPAKIFILNAIDFEKLIENNPSFRQKIASIANQRKAVTASLN